MDLVYEPRNDFASSLFGGNMQRSLTQLILLVHVTTRSHCPVQCVNKKISWKIHDLYYCKVEKSKKLQSSQDHDVQGCQAGMLPQAEKTHLKRSHDAFIPQDIIYMIMRT
jgi:hypothetical protein